MERNAEGPANKTASGNTTPEKVLSFINAIYNHWVYNEYGVQNITPQLVQIIESSGNFALCKTKSQVEPEGFEWKIVEFPNCFKFELKASASLYRESGCASNMITTPQYLATIQSKLESCVGFPVRETIITQLERFKPVIRSPQAANVYYSLLRNMLAYKVSVFPDVTTKRFELIIQK